MFKSLRCLKREQLIGVLLVLLIHGAALYELWGYHIVLTPAEALPIMVSLINHQPPEQHKPPKSKLPKPRSPKSVEPPKPQQIVALATVVLPDEPLAYSPPTPPPPPPEIVAPPLPLQPVTLSDELSLSCPERSPPAYPSLSIRMNEQGKVVLRVMFGEEGSITSAEVKSSSGYPRLDDAALKTVRTWHCMPPLRNGVAMRAVALQPFNFILEGR